jgi:muramoyltetrapeptide carboxypeptidase
MNTPTLNNNDEIRIISPSGSINPEYINGAKKILESWGLKVSVSKFACGEYGRFAGTVDQRISDLQAALDNPTLKAILCSRGGYGIAQIIDKVDFSKFQTSPKWLIGFSDITILHNALTNLGIPSIHGMMAKQLTELSAYSEQILSLKEILFGKLPFYSIPAHKLNRYGVGIGKLIGGNLSVLMALRGSKFDLHYRNNILFIEDIAEKPYHIDRMMQNLRFSGVLSQLSGLVVGQFSDCDEDPLMMQTISEIILNATSQYNYPVCFNFPAGHIDYNLPLVLGVNAKLIVNETETNLTY